MRKYRGLTPISPYSSTNGWVCDFLRNPPSVAPQLHAGWASSGSIPIIFTVSQLLEGGDQLYQIDAGVRYWADAPAKGPKGWGFRLQLTLLFPR